MAILFYLSKKAGSGEKAWPVLCILRHGPTGSGQHRTKLGAHVEYTQGVPRQLVYSLVWNGQFGVQIFFAVSGFLIMSTAMRRWGSLAQVNVGDFYKLRFARIAPLLLLLLAVLSSLHEDGSRAVCCGDSVCRSAG